MASVRIANDLISEAETITDKYYVKLYSYIRVIAKLCLLSLFIDDTLWKCYDWSLNLEFVMKAMGTGYLITSLVVVINIIGVFVGCAMILIQKHVPYACGFILYTVLFQNGTLIKESLWSSKALLREASLIGSIIMLLLDHMDRDDTQHPGETRFEEDRRKNLMQLGGRCLLVLMFISDLQSQRASLSLILLDIVACTLMALVVLGYRTRLSAFTLTILLTVLNFQYNSWWNQTRDSHYVKYEFFRALSVIGGLLMVTILGPGGFSVDEAKKHW